MEMSNILVTNFIPSILISLGLSVILIVLNWYLFLIILGFFPVIFFANRYLGKITQKKVFAYQRSFEGFSKVTMFIMKFMDLITIHRRPGE
jgi:ABC-type multidrug transport system fused ATPase/permease subunit